MPFRLSDLAIPFGEGSSREEFTFMMNYMFSYLNRSRPSDQQLQYLQVPSTSATKQERKQIEDLNRGQCVKFFRYFAQNLGTQVGKLHANGVAHGFLHRGNLTPDGTFVDIDSLHGEPIDGKTITQKDILNDIGSVMRSIDEVMQILSQEGIIPSESSEKIRESFLYRYAHTRWQGNSNADTRLDEMSEIMIAIEEHELANKPIIQKHTPQALWQHIQASRQHKIRTQALSTSVIDPLLGRLRKEKVQAA